ncbi:MAG TPA: hydroxyacid dehydrogenase [Nitrososphaerales archaeon]|nr:hydroxyacid dehydrogenase [Nitrososphaerales archaeon]
MTKVLVSDHVDIEKLSLGPGFEVDYRPGIQRDELLKLIGSYEVLVVRSRTKVDRELLDRASRLRLVARPGTGLDNVDVEHAKSKGVQVVNSPESLVEAVAEHVLLLMLALSRKLPVAASTTAAGKWEKESLLGVELKGKVLGVVGFGRIGRRVGEIASVIGMKILAYDVIPIPPEVIAQTGCRVVGLDELLASSDYITLHVPMTDQTRHMLDGRRLSNMKKSAFLVNTSRGGVVDEQALADALKRGSLAGTALDVFEKEPPTGEILGAPNTILTPHIGGQTAEAQSDAITVVGEKVRAFFSRA